MNKFFKTYGAGFAAAAYLMGTDLVGAYAAAAIGGQKMVDASLIATQMCFPGAGCTGETLFRTKEVSTEVVYNTLGYDRANRTTLADVQRALKI